MTGYSAVYASYAVGNKEPNRDDIINYISFYQPGCTNCQASDVKPEHLQDFELGYRFIQEQTQFLINGYFMNYKDQLVLTGAINNVGEAIRVNVPKSYRAGIEVQFAQKIGDKFLVNLNLTLSQNKIKNFTEVVPSYDETPNEV